MSVDDPCPTEKGHLTPGWNRSVCGRGGVGRRWDRLAELPGGGVTEANAQEHGGDGGVRGAQGLPPPRRAGVSSGSLAGESERSALRFLFLQREEFHPNRIYLAVSAPD